MAVRYPSSPVYSNVYSDDQYDYRHVILDRDCTVEMLRMCLGHNLQNADKDTPITQLPRRLMSEDEWRYDLGICMSQGWVHYEQHMPEPHVLLFRRPGRGVMTLMQPSSPLLASQPSSSDCWYLGRPSQGKGGPQAKKRPQTKKRSEASQTSSSESRCDGRMGSGLADIVGGPGQGKKGPQAKTRPQAKKGSPVKKGPLAKKSSPAKKGPPTTENPQAECPQAKTVSPAKTSPQANKMGRSRPKTGKAKKHTKADRAVEAIPSLS